MRLTRRRVEFVPTAPAHAIVARMIPHVLNLSVVTPTQTSDTDSLLPVSMTFRWDEGGDSVVECRGRLIY